MSTTSTLEQKFSRLTMLNLQIADSENQQLKKAVEWRTQLANECLILISELLKEEQEKIQKAREKFEIVSKEGNKAQPTDSEEEPEGLTEAEVSEGDADLYDVLRP